MGTLVRRRNGTSGTGRINLRLLLILVVAAGFGTFYGVRTIVRQSQVGPLKPQLSSYLAMPADVSSLTDDHPKLAGRKVVCVCENEHGFDESHYYLDAAQRAGKPDDVAAVVQVTRREEHVGTYDNGAGDAFRLHADVTVVDRSTGKVIATRSFAGGDPPATKKKSQSGKGSAPLQEIVDWLKTI